MPPYAIVAGNPARVKKYRFEPDVISKLLSVKWWDWEDWDIASSINWLQSNDKDKFFGFADRFREVDVGGGQVLRFLEGEGIEEIQWRAIELCKGSLGGDCDVSEVVDIVLRSCSVVPATL